MIKTIEIMCLPCQKCTAMKNSIDFAIKCIERKYEIKIHYEYKFTPTLKDASKYSMNASQAPIVVINGNVELCGFQKQDMVLVKLDSIHRIG